jgi:mono/diheme cytochrome c family protein
MVIGFVIFWVVLGLGAFFVAMRGGPRGARQALHTESKASQRAVTLGVVLVFAFGLAIPALVLAFTGSNRAADAVGGLHLNAEQQEGRELFSHSCGVCHTLAATNSVGRIGPDLDVLVPQAGENHKLREGFVLSAIMTGFAQGNGQMPALLYEGREAQAVADFVAAVAGH